MSLKVQSAIDVSKTESVSQVYATPSHPSNVQKVSSLEQETRMDKLWKEETSRGGLAVRPDKAEVESAVESINDAIEHINRALRFSVHEDTQRVMVKVVNIRTDEIIKELPPEAVLDTVARIREMIGLLIDERA